MQVRIHVMDIEFTTEGAKDVVRHPFSSIFSRTPQPGEFIKGFGTDKAHQVLYVVHDANGSADVFVSNAYPPSDIAKAIGLKDSGMPSLVGFEGETVGELIAFLSEYPSDYKVVFQNEANLVAKAKSGYIILRLDDKDE